MTPVGRSNQRRHSGSTPWGSGIRGVSTHAYAGAHELATNMTSGSIRPPGAGTHHNTVSEGNHHQANTRAPQASNSAHSPLIDSRSDPTTIDQIVVAVTHNVNGTNCVNVAIDSHVADAQTIRREIASKIMGNPDINLAFNIYPIVPPGSTIPPALDDNQLFVAFLQGDNRGTLKLFAELSMVVPRGPLVSHAPTQPTSTASSTIIPARLTMPQPCITQHPSGTSSATESNYNLPSDFVSRHEVSSRRSAHSNLQPDANGNVAMPEPVRTSPVNPPREHIRRFSVPYCEESPPPIVQSPSSCSLYSLPSPCTPQAGHSTIARNMVCSESGGMSEAQIVRQDSGYYEGISMRRYHERFQNQVAREDHSPSGTISRRMTMDEVLHELHRHGCQSMSPYINRSMSSDSPVAGGGFGDIYRGVLNNGAEVSLKCVRLEVELDDGGQRKVKDAARELYIWSKCKHPNVLELMGVTQHRGQIAMVSPWMGNGDLTRFLTAHPEVDRYDLCAQIADGVAYLHQESVIHGDIKGANILVSEDHTPKITDFGTASRIDCTLQFTETSGSQHMSIYWTAPEIINESLDKGTAEADVFSLGMTILEVFTGTAPFAGMHPVAAMKKITDGVHPVRPEKHIPSGDDRADLLWSLLVDCWAFRPQDRPTASDVKYRMEAIARI